MFTRTTVQIGTFSVSERSQNIWISNRVNVKNGQNPNNYYDGPHSRDRRPYLSLKQYMKRLNKNTAIVP